MREKKKSPGNTHRSSARVIDEITELIVGSFLSLAGARDSGEEEEVETEEQGLEEGEEEEMG